MRLPLYEERGRGEARGRGELTSAFWKSTLLIARKMINGTKHRKSIALDKWASHTRQVGTKLRNNIASPGPPGLLSAFLFFPIQFILCWQGWKLCPTSAFHVHSAETLFVPPPPPPPVCIQGSITGLDGSILTRASPGQINLSVTQGIQPSPPASWRGKHGGGKKWVSPH